RRDFDAVQAIVAGTVAAAGRRRFKVDDDRRTEVVAQVEEVEDRSRALHRDAVAVLEHHVLEPAVHGAREEGPAPERAGRRRAAVAQRYGTHTDRPGGTAQRTQAAGLHRHHGRIAHVDIDAGID